MVTLENLTPNPDTNQFLLEKEIKEQFSDCFKEFQENEDSYKQLDESQTPFESMRDNLYLVYYHLGNEVLRDFLNQEGK